MPVVGELRPTLNIPQARFMALPHKYRAFVAGFGSGKTWVGGASLCSHAWQYPRINAGYFAPSYPQIRDIFYPTIEEVAHTWGLKVQVREANKEVHLYAGRQYRSTILCRSMEKPDTIVGFKIGHALVDELDTLKASKAQQAWRKIIARMRYNVDGLRNGIDVTTTPEGFRFVYQQWEKAPAERPELRSLYGMVQASTYDNAANQPKDYIPSLLATYPAQLIAAYLDGKFCNLTSGSVYPGFDRHANATTATLARREALHVGMDFNVGNMSAVVCVIRDEWPLALEELTGLLDTPAMIRALKERYPEQPITVYPDAAGGSRNTNDASTSDLALLRHAGFAVRAPLANPSVRDRLVSVNALLCNGQGLRRLKVNVAGCPKLVEDLEQQTYTEHGAPDKDGGHDHRPDALGYFIHQRFPAQRTARPPDADRRAPAELIKPFSQRWLEYTERDTATLRDT